MKAVAKYICWFLFPLFCLFLLAVWPVESEVIRSPYQAQLQLIEAGYEKVWVKGEWKILKADTKWGPISQAAYNQYVADKVTKRMSK